MIQRFKRGVVNIHHRYHLQPGGRLSHPDPYRGWRGRMTQLIRHDRRDKYLFEQAWQKVNLTNLNEVAKRAGIRDNQAHQKPRRLKPARSRSRSSTLDRKSVV